MLEKRRCGKKDKDTHAAADGGRRRRPQRRSALLADRLRFRLDPVGVHVMLWHVYMDRTFGRTDVYCMFSLRPVDDVECDILTGFKRLVAIHDNG